METQLGIDENDVFYIDLRRQMLLLTSDDGDEEEEHEEEHMSLKPRTSSFANNILPATSLSQASWSWGNLYVDPMWLVQVNLQKSGNGTGVFIPQVTSPMRKHKSGRKKRRKSKNSEKRKMQQVGAQGMKP